MHKAGEIFNPMTRETLQNKSELSEAQQLTALREQIDAIDAQLATLVDQRRLLTISVGQTKANFAEVKSRSVVFRPAREEAILRRLQQLQPDLPKVYIYALWRQIISFGYQAQRDLAFGLLASPEAGALSRFAAAHFGQFSSYNDFTTPQKLLEAIAAEQIDVGIFPCPLRSQWWCQMIDLDQSHTKNISIQGSIPDYTQNSDQPTAAALFIAQGQLEIRPDQLVSTWIGLKSDEPQLCVEQLRAKLEAEGIEYRLVHNQAYFLVQLQAFYPNESPTLKQLAELSSIEMLKIMGHSCA